MQTLTLPDLQIDYGWTAPDIPDSRQLLNQATGDVYWLRDNSASPGVIAGELGVSNERVRQIEAQALLKCRRSCNRNGYRLEDLVRYL